VPARFRVRPPVEIRTPPPGGRDLDLGAGRAAIRHGTELVIVTRPPCRLILVFGAAVSEIGGWLPRTGVRSLILAGCASFPAGFGWLAQADAGSGYLINLLGPTLLIAAGIRLTFPTFMVGATADAPESDAGVIGGLANTASQVGGSIGLAVLLAAADARIANGDTAGVQASAVASGYDPGLPRSRTRPGYRTTVRAAAGTSSVSVCASGSRSLMVSALGRSSSAFSPKLSPIGS
jgi:hypothetical protein